MGTPAVSVRRASLAEIIALRHAELRPGLPRAAAEFEGDDEPTSLHFGAFLAPGGDVVGCASLVLRAWRAEAAYQLRGMATRADVARRGIGRTLLVLIENEVRATTTVRVLWCNAREAAVPFYARSGWTVASAVFDIPTVGPHHAMVRRLPDQRLAG
jgi:GNAT superfamily N-acetyltransferase